MSITTGGAEFNIASTSLQTSVTIQEWGSAMNSSKPAAEGGIDSLPEPNVTGTDPSASAPSEPENYAGLGLDDVNPGVPPPKLSHFEIARQVLAKYSPADTTGGAENEGT